MLDAMYYRPAFFELRELVPPDAYELYGERLWVVFDDRILRAADMLRAEFGAMTVNDWPTGGPNRYRGWRPPGCAVGAGLSQHRFGRGLDLVAKRAPAHEIRRIIIQNPEMLRDKDGKYLVTAVEAGVPWLHIDCRNHDVYRHGIKVFGQS